jgi:hypothetical protein
MACDIHIHTQHWLLTLGNAPDIYSSSESGHKRPLYSMLQLNVISNLGTGIPNLFTTQGIKHMELMISAGTSKALPGQLLRESFEAFLT